MASLAAQNIKRVRGKKVYEVNNHLGNVLATVADRRTGVDDSSDGLVDYYTADLVSGQDYYAFGMIMPERDYSDYRFGFQGQEQDDEVKGKGNNINFTFRMHDARIGRFFAVDPLFKTNSMISSYNHAYNSPIQNIDLKGEKGTFYLQVLLDNKGSPVIDKTTMNDVVNELNKQLNSINLKVDIELVYGNNVLSTEEFQNREGAMFSDHYFIIGTESDLVSIQGSKESNYDFNNKGWDWGLAPDQPSTYYGHSAKHQFFALLNASKFNSEITNHPIKNKAKLIAHTILHEQLHPKTIYHPNRRKSHSQDKFDLDGLKDASPGYVGHVRGTVLSETYSNSKFNDYMKKIMTLYHGEKKGSSFSNINKQEKINWWKVISDKRKTDHNRTDINEK